MTPAEFIAKWKDNKLSEGAGAQAHLLDLCELLGVEKPSDPENYCFERGLTNLCNARQQGAVQWRKDAHRTLNAAVVRAYGWDDYTPDMPDEETLRRLLKLNLERAKQ